MQQQGIYVHVPFCARKCQYCDFHSIVADENFVGRYFSAFHRELLQRGQETSQEQFDTLFIGGGTPSILNDVQLQQMLGSIRHNFRFSSNAEATMEVNPSSLDRQKLETIKAGGINRLSFGVQAFQDSLLHQLGRLHSVADVYRTVEDAKAVGFASISMDLMFGLPGQTLTDWQDSLVRAVDLGVQHISAYSLILEEGTAFYQWAKKGLLALPNEDDEFAMFEAAMSLLPKHGLHQYEISNYAHPGSESRHNSLYWTSQPYLALGSGAVGSWRGRRYRNSKDLEHYISGWCDSGHETIDVEETLTKDDAMDEFMMTGLRLLRGVSGNEFSLRFGVRIEDVYPRQLDGLLSRRLVEWTKEGYLRLTSQGIPLGNLVFSAWLRGV